MHASARRLGSLDASSLINMVGTQLKPIGLVALAACLGACSSQQTWRSSSALGSPRPHPATAQATATADAPPATIAGAERPIAARPTQKGQQGAESASSQPAQATAASDPASTGRTTATPAALSAGQDGAGAAQDIIAPAPSTSAAASEAQTPSAAAMSSVEPSGAQTGVRPAGLTAQSPGADNGGAQQPDLASSSSTRAPRQTEPEPLASDRQDTSASALAESALNGGGEQAAARGESGPTDGTGETSSSSASREPNGSADTRSAGSTNTRAQRETAARSDATENTAAVALPGGVPQPFAESDSAAGSSTDQRAAPAQQIAGIVEAPGRTVTSHDVVVPQRLDGLLPMTLGVEGNGEFDFDRAVLRPEVKPRLDQLADQLSAAEYDRLDIVGHTDRIGATDYNQYLSERRAWAVARYLLARGVPQGKLHVEGRGTREPLTKPEECPFEAREQLIPCLQKDRRVEISASIRKADVEVQ